MRVNSCIILLLPNRCILYLLKPSECFLIYNCENKNDETNKSVVFYSLIQPGQNTVQQRVAGPTQKALTRPTCLVQAMLLVWNREHAMAQSGERKSPLVWMRTWMASKRMYRYHSLVLIYPFLIAGQIFLVLNTWFSFFFSSS